MDKETGATRNEARGVGGRIRSEKGTATAKNGGGKEKEEKKRRKSWRIPISVIPRTEGEPCLARTSFNM